MELLPQWLLAKPSLAVQAEIQRVRVPPDFVVVVPTVFVSLFSESSGRRESRTLDLPVISRMLLPLSYSPAFVDRRCGTDDTERTRRHTYRLQLESV